MAQWHYKPNRLKTQYKRHTALVLVLVVPVLVAVIVAIGEWLRIWP